MTQREIDLMEAESSLKWAAEGEFSARITPRQARALLAERELLINIANTFQSWYLRMLRVRHAERS